MDNPAWNIRKGNDMAIREHKTVYLKDYSPPPFLVETVELRIVLHEAASKVISTLKCRRNEQVNELDTPFILEGERLELVSVKINNKLLEKGQFLYSEDKLEILEIPKGVFELTTEVLVNPSGNTELEGLYLSSGNYCTQCEAEGFRRITFFPDRPDVMAIFSTTVIANKKECPVLLSNGNLVEKGEMDGGLHFATWHDPFPKPSYLFALVAGDLVFIEDQYKTISGREVTLHIYVEKRNIEKCDHAMISLKKSMNWDEQVYGREYDLDVYMIVAVDDFNMGAMENKGLNVFNSKYVLAKPETASDADYDGIEGVIGHEYFHNWTGNRITCRDWFQLSLKEGLTVFRDQEFSSDMGSRAVKRINDVRVMRNFQFREDSGPMSHPVRPSSYMEINNFYTLTVYNKGAEVVRMLHSLLGPQVFRAGMDLYFKRHDSQAVTCDDFIRSFEDVYGLNLEQFKRWYCQAGTPEVKVEQLYDAERKKYVLSLAQDCSRKAGKQDNKPLFMPIAVGLLDVRGNDMELILAGDDEQSKKTTRQLHFKEKKQKFVFEKVAEKPVLSFLRNFSAPIKVIREYDDAELSFLVAHDSDSFNRWDAGQQLCLKSLLRQIKHHEQGEEFNLPEIFSRAFKALLVDQEVEPAFKALVLDLPAENWISQQVDTIEPSVIFEARKFFVQALGREMAENFLAVFKENNSNDVYHFDAESAGRRSLKNICLDYLLHGESLNNDGELLRDLGLHQYYNASNMTDVFAALKTIVNVSRSEGDVLLEDFYDKWRDDPLVVDKWLALQASCVLPGTLDRVIKLTSHSAFSIQNPNKVRALIATFCSVNQSQFHCQDGSGYSFLVDKVEELDVINPQIAARMLTPLTMWRRFNLKRQELMRIQLKRVKDFKNLSADVDEIVSKSLAVD